MKNEFPISNLRAKYADKTADGKDISEAIAEAQLAGDIPVLTEDNIVEILQKRPKFISYAEGSLDPAIYVLQDNSDTSTAYYSTSWGDEAKTLSIQSSGIGVQTFNLVTSAGTKLYKHEINLDYTDENKDADSIRLIIYNNISESFTGVYTSSVDLLRVLFNNMLQAYQGNYPYLYQILSFESTDEAQTTKITLYYITEEISEISGYGFNNFTITDTVTPL